jgi:hypothetical protein
MTTNVSSTRRRFLGLVGAGTATALVGCTGSSDGGSSPNYREGEVDVPSDATPRNAEETAAAQAAAGTQANQNVSPMDDLELANHAFSYEGGYTGSTVQGVVENTGNDRMDTVEVRVRVYNSDDQHIGRYVASTGDLSGSSSWSFQVILLASPADIASYDVAVLGLPA